MSLKGIIRLVLTIGVVGDSQNADKPDAVISPCHELCAVVEIGNSTHRGSYLTCHALDRLTCGGFAERTVVAGDPAIHSSSFGNPLR